MVMKILSKISQTKQGAKKVATSNLFQKVLKDILISSPTVRLSSDADDLLYTLISHKDLQIIQVMITTGYMETIVKQSYYFKASYLSKTLDCIIFCLDTFYLEQGEIREENKIKEMLYTPYQDLETPIGKLYDKHNREN